MTATSRLGAVTIAAVTAVLMVSCSETTGKPSTPVTSKQSAPGDASSSSKNSDVPTVSNPLDVSTLQADPCNALSAQQAEQLGLKPGNTDSVSVGPTCEYDYEDVVGNRVTVGINKEFDEGLAEIYKRKEALGYFKETTVGDYPAVYAGRYDDRNQGVCMLHIGLTNSFAPNLFAQLSGGTDKSRPCQVTEKVAEAMIKHLKGGA